MGVFVCVYGVTNIKGKARLLTVITLVGFLLFDMRFFVLFVINVSSRVGYKFAARFSPLDLLLFCFSSVNATTFFVATNKKIA